MLAGKLTSNIVQYICLYCEAVCVCVCWDGVTRGAFGEVSYTSNTHAFRSVQYVSHYSADLLHHKCDIFANYGLAIIIDLYVSIFC